MIFTTSICANYLDKALVLATSIKEKCKNATFVLCLLEEQAPTGKELGVFDKVILAKNLNIPDFYNFIFQYDIVEASTSVKGHLMTHLLESYPKDMCVYVDPDCQVFSDMVELLETTTDAPIVLAPHMLEAGNIDMEISSLKHGVFNLGFLALRPCEESLKFSRWWADRLYYYSHADFNRGLFTDQKWINLAPCFFNVKILKHPGYDFATWSFMERKLGKKDNEFTVNGLPLRFVHFSGFDSGNFRWAFEQWGDKKNKELGTELEETYKANLAKFSSLKVKTIPWSYATYKGGIKIEKKTRTAYSKNFKTMLGFNPFEDKKKVATMLKREASKKTDIGLGLRITRKLKRMIKG